MWLGLDPELKPFNLEDSILSSREIKSNIDVFY